MSYTFRPAERKNTPLIIGIAGPTKSGKTMSSLRLATGLANGGTIAMLNAEGPRGHQYADKFKYVACELEPPFRATKYTEALEEVKKIKPAVVLIDSGSHMHDGPGGALEWHEEELDRMAKGDPKKRERVTFAAWIKIKAAETQFIYAMLSLDCPLIIALRAKEKLKLVKGNPVDLGWQPIVGERVAFETLFTLMLPPHSKGVPDLSISDMREPFDTLVPQGRQIDEALGESLAAWARGGSPAKPGEQRSGKITKEQLDESERLIADVTRFQDAEMPKRLFAELFPGKKSRQQLTEQEAERYLTLLRAACGEPTQNTTSDSADIPFPGEDETR